MADLRKMPNLSGRPSQPQYLHYNYVINIANIIAHHKHTIIYNCENTNRSDSVRKYPHSTVSSVNAARSSFQFDMGKVKVRGNTLVRLMNTLA